MPTIDTVQLERILEKIRRKSRIVAEKPLPGKDVPHRESVSGRGLEWEIRGVLSAANLDDLIAKEQNLEALADGQVKTLDEYDDPSKDAYSVLVSDVEINRLAGQLYRSNYVLRLLLKAIQYRRLAQTYPTVTQQLLASLNYCHKVQPQTLPGVSQAMQYVIGMSVRAQTLPTILQTFSYELTQVVTLERTTYGKILYDNFDDDSLDPAWVYEEGVAGNSVAEQNGRLEFIHAENSYAHVQRTFGGVDNPVLIAKIQQAQQAEMSWAACIGLWFNQYDYVKCGVRPGDASGYRNQFARDTGGTTAYSYTGDYTAGTWRYFKLIITSSTVYAYYSDDGQTWTLIGSVSRASSWTIDANSLIILGHGHEKSSSELPNPDWNNNYSSTGSDINSYFDDFIMMRGEAITVNGLSDGWYFKVRKGSNYHQSSAASGGSATLDISSLPLPPYDELELYDNNNNLILDNQFPGDVWGGDVYNYTG